MEALPFSPGEQRFTEVVKTLGYNNIPVAQARNSGVSYDERPACCSSNSCVPICPTGAKYDAATFADRPVRSFAETEMTPAEIDALFAARRTVKGDLKYLGERFPSPANMPNPETVRGWHLDLIAALDLTSDSVASMRSFKNVQWHLMPGQRRCRL
jgi:hypothetical protein